MSDFKSKLPDFKEMTSIASKLFKDVKQSVSEIIDDYKKKREEGEAAEEQQSKPAADNEVVVGKAKTTEPVTPAPKKTKPPVQGADPVEPPKGE
ncbi:hypothetical protein DIZ81_10075 [Legionella taurinensis]|uniref:Uncharacterized protein n=1 Tax=Legionella taurinensis TaxID=70611 RepID=A0A3A5L4N7_9GAMM|nr:hypothetical protein [Legionella taurinensis]MDX1837930.1 hypothetical protein [Legionella taurinensis]PUT39475.1 hypothetical protein DB744_10085 [Legionella taurinensis]PUT41784.1 hypothetical protein DB746_09000 [Legionella taurinensis]PUT44618.1 hypothetical protein DB743_08215 [Legionella taurinensis]PUT46862.1 hypothetical protein DB745_10080 [Legionella taurinensis]